MAGIEKRKLLLDNSLVSNVPFKSIGPSIQSGRVDDLEVSPQDPTHFYVAYASGGLWKTENNGQSFDPIFDNEAVMTIGDIAVDWDKNTIWVGTGEVNSSRSSYAGAGMFRSDDGGKTWQQRGLEETHHIGRVVLHPTDPNTLWVAALGHLYSPNAERGVFKTTDAGATWRKVLFVDENSGAVDLVIDPKDPNTLYAAIWHRERRAWNLVESGLGSGIYKSTDGGETWAKISAEGSSFPDGEGTGRIGLAIGEKDGNSVVYAIVDNQNRRPKEAKEKTEDLTKDDLRSMTKDAFLKLDKDKVKNYLSDNGFPKKYNADKVFEMVKKDEITPNALVEFTEDANSLLFNTPVVGAEVYVSTDFGKSWKKTHDGYLDDLFYSYGYYFGQIRVAPQNADRIYVFGVPILKSEDGGQSWKSIGGDNVHADHHALWANPNRSGHLVLGNDGGINISYDNGENWIKCNTPAVGQFYAVAVDMAKNYNVYGGLQDNGVWTGPHTYEADVNWHDSGQYPYKSILGGDGMQVAVDTRDNETVYTGFQFGNYYRINRSSRESERITPQHDLGERPLRWNWQTPIHLSRHNEDILYIGSNKLHRSFNQGKDWEAISGDLTNGGIKGDVPFGTLTSIHESPKKFGLIYTGSDGGLVHVTRDGGNTWANISAGLQAGFWVSRVEASAVVLGRVYVSLNGYRNDNFEAMVYVSENYGDTWQRIGTDLPQEPVNVVREDPKNPDLLYVGTDHGLYISLDRGQHFMQMNKDLPAVAVHDLVVHPRENELVVGTHGRSMFLADVKEVQQLVDSVLQKNIYAFEIPKLRYRSNWGNLRNSWSEKAPEPDIELGVFTKSGGKLKITVMTGDLKLKTWEVDVTHGLNYPEYHGDISDSAVTAFAKQLNEKKKKGDKEILVEKAKNGKYYLKKGSYKVVYEKDGNKANANFVIE
ncbi:MAG: glycosyl hydrolase [Saprospiraceae bacterium]|nr:glycosyl hydrolase [Saprospiraceae bacterium]MCF8248584.1 glycosyl hydrolase [Saprospiraceae bacterium]MCF8310317.1 glycosyl hydrolase [Saprospiraceae bacterium]MCF8439243.1 glycosyl hydrolase [Saprospiraceae bacterium]